MDLKHFYQPTLQHRIIKVLFPSLCPISLFVPFRFSEKRIPKGDTFRRCRDLLTGAEKRIPRGDTFRRCRDPLTGAGKRIPEGNPFSKTPGSFLGAEMSCTFFGAAKASTIQSIRSSIKSKKYYSKLIGGKMDSTHSTWHMELGSWHTLILIT
jgi:hypothetical protein